jgi:hypothetical protein
VYAPLSYTFEKGELGRVCTPQARPQSIFFIFHIFSIFPLIFFSTFEKEGRDWVSSAGNGDYGRALKVARKHSSV